MQSELSSILMNHLAGVVADVSSEILMPLVVAADICSGLHGRTFELQLVLVYVFQMNMSQV